MNFPPELVEEFYPFSFTAGTYKRRPHHQVSDVLEHSFIKCIIPGTDKMHEAVIQIRDLVIAQFSHQAVIAQYQFIIE